MAGYGESNPALTQAIRLLANANTSAVRFSSHALAAMDDDGFDPADVVLCLRKGTAHGPEIQNAQLRANVVHRGLHLRVVVGGSDDIQGDWSSLRMLTVMKAT
jgi:hypothetical protein